MQWQGDHAGTLRNLSAVALVRRGVTKLWQFDYAGALQDLDQAMTDEALKLHPNYVFALIIRGWIKQSQGDHAGTLQDLDEALKLNQL